MKPYDVHINVSIATQESYSPTYAIKFNITEQLPVNTEPQKYLRARISEELKRHFDKLAAPIENFTDEGKEKAAEVDPLATDTPF